MLATPFPIITEASEVHLQNTAAPILVALSGMVMLVNAVQSLKAFSPIETTLLGIVKVASELQRSKAPPPIPVSELGKWKSTEESWVQP